MIDYKGKGWPDMFSKLLGMDNINWIEKGFIISAAKSQILILYRTIPFVSQIFSNSNFKYFIN